MALERTAPPSSGLRTVMDTIVTPKEAFADLRIVPTWGWAFLIAFVLMIAGYYIQRPATIHASLGTFHHLFQSNPVYASLSDAKKQHILDAIAHPPLFEQIAGIVQLAITLLLAAFFNAAILLLGSNLGRGTATLRQLWAGSMNIAVPSFGLASIVTAAICIARGPQTFNSIGDIMHAVPSALWLAPNATGHLAGMLAGINVFSLWGCGLNILMMRVLAGVTGALAWVFPIAILLMTAILEGSFASMFTS